MKAIVIHQFGGNDLTTVEDIPRPEPGKKDVIVRVHAASINPIDWKIRNGNLRFLTGSKFPRILGGECAGDVVAIGSDVTQFKTGAAVIAVAGIRGMGCFAEYICASESSVFRKRAAVSFEEAASLPIAGLTALQALRDKGRIAPGMSILVNGASGGVGHYAVQIAKILGARVTAVCSGANAEFVTALGADRVIDYRSEDFAEGSEKYDIVFDAVAKSSFGKCKRVLTRRGTYISTLPSLAVILNQYFTGFFGGQTARMINVSPRQADLDWMMTEIEAGRIKTRIDRAYPLEQAKEALAHSEGGRVKGKVVLRLVEQ